MHMRAKFVIYLDIDHLEIPFVHIDRDEICYKERSTPNLCSTNDCKNFNCWESIKGEGDFFWKMFYCLALFFTLILVSAQTERSQDPNPGPFIDVHCINIDDTMHLNRHNSNGVLNFANWREKRQINSSNKGKMLFAALIICIWRPFLSFYPAFT